MCVNPLSALTLLPQKAPLWQEDQVLWGATGGGGAEESVSQ